MKKTVFMLLALVLCLSMMGAAASADYSEGYFYYIIEDESITITGYFGNETEVTVPSGIAGIPVNAIAAGAFEGTSVQILHLPDTIRAVDEGGTGSAAVDYADEQMQAAADETAAGENNAYGAGSGESGTNYLGEEIRGEEPPGAESSPEPTSPETEEVTQGEAAPAEFDSASVEGAAAEDSAPPAEPTDTAPAPTAEKTAPAVPLIIAGLVVCAAAAVLVLRKKKSGAKQG